MIENAWSLDWSRLETCRYKSGITKHAGVRQWAVLCSSPPQNFYNWQKGISVATRPTVLAALTAASKTKSGAWIKSPEELTDWVGGGEAPSWLELDDATDPRRMMPPQARRAQAVAQPDVLLRFLRSYKEGRITDQGALETLRSFIQMGLASLAVFVVCAASAAPASASTGVGLPRQDSNLKPEERSGRRRRKGARHGRGGLRVSYSNVRLRILVGGKPRWSPRILGRPAKVV